MLTDGDRAPDFSLPNQNGELISLAGLLQQGEVLLYFYPADFTPVCTAETCAFRDRYPELRAVDANVVGISPQSVESHKRFADTFNVPFSLLFDAGKRVIRAYGVDGPMGFGVRRASFRIGTDGIIRTRVLADLFIGGHVQLAGDMVKL